MSGKNCCVAIYNARRDVEATLDALHRQGCNLKDVSLVGKGVQDEHQPFAYAIAAGHVRFYGEHEAFWNRVSRMLGATACFWERGQGPYAAAGSIVAILVEGEGNLTISGGLRALGTALYALGVPGEGALRYQTMVRDGSLLLVVHGNRPDVEQASDTISLSNGVEMAVHAA